MAMSVMSNEELTELDGASTAIQSNVKAWLMRRNYSNLRGSVARLERWWQGRDRTLNGGRLDGRGNRATRTLAASRLQAATRGHAARRDYQQLRSMAAAVLVIQRKTKAWMGRRGCDDKGGMGDMDLGDLGNLGDLGDLGDLGGGGGGGGGGAGGGGNAGGSAKGVVGGVQPMDVAGGLALGGRDAGGGGGLLQMGQVGQTGQMGLAGQLMRHGSGTSNHSMNSMNSLEGGGLGGALGGGLAGDIGGSGIGNGNGDIGGLGGLGGLGGGGGDAPEHSPDIFRQGSETPSQQEFFDSLLRDTQPDGDGDEDDRRDLLAMDDEDLQL
jgi:hypothetical protein